ncbi:MAG: hypothetical protein R3Y22_02420 [Bacteroidales bacterium]
MKKLTVYFILAITILTSCSKDLSPVETYTPVTESVAVSDLMDKLYICCWGSSSVEGYLGNYDKYVVDNGHNLTIPNTNNIKMSFPRMLATLTKDDGYEVWNCGVGGEGMPTIMARMGVINMYNDTEFVLPSDGSYVDIASYENGTFLKSKFDDSIVTPNESYDSEDSFEAHSILNPVIVSGVECTLDLYTLSDNVINNSGANAFKNGVIRLKRNIIGGVNVNIPKGTEFIPYSTELFKSQDIVHIYLIGANGGWYSTTDFADKIDEAIKYYGDKYLILGYHTPNIFDNYSDEQKAQFNIDIPTADEFREFQRAEYGSHFLDLRYLISKCWFIDYAAKYDLTIKYVSENGAGVFNGYSYQADDISVIPEEYRYLLEEMPTEWKENNLPSDIQCYNLEIPPTTLMADPSSQTSSGQHCNYHGYVIMGHYIYDKLISLGYLLN